MALFFHILYFRVEKKKKKKVVLLMFFVFVFLFLITLSLVMMRDKRHLGDLSGDHSATDLKEERSPNLEVRLIHIGHRDVLAEDGAGTTTADSTHLLALLVVNSSTLTSRSASRDKADTLARHAVLDLVEDRASTNETTFLTSSLS